MILPESATVVGSKIEAASCEAFGLGDEGLRISGGEDDASRLYVVLSQNRLHLRGVYVGWCASFMLPVSEQLDAKQTRRLFARGAANQELTSWRMSMDGHLISEYQIVLFIQSVEGRGCRQTSSNSMLRAPSCGLC